MIHLTQSFPIFSQNLTTDFSYLSVTPNTSLSDVVDFISQQKSSCCVLVIENVTENGLPILPTDVDERQLLGYLTEHEIIKLLKSGISFPSVKISQVMNRDMGNLQQLLASAFAQQRCALLESMVADVNDAISRDIMARQKVEAELALANEQLKAVIDAIPGCVSWISAEGYYLGVNQHLAKNFQLSPGDFIGKEIGFMPGYHQLKDLFQDFIASNDTQKSQTLNIHLPDRGSYYVLVVMQKYQQGNAVLAIGMDISSRVKTELALIDAQKALQQANKDLELRVAERTEALETTNQQLLREISDRRYAEAQLRQSKKILQIVIDNIPQSVFWKDTNSVYLGCNLNSAKILGLNSTTDIIGKTDNDLPWFGNQCHRYQESDRRVINTNQPEYHILEQLQQADGEHIWLETNKIPLHDNTGNVIGILGTSEDITERITAQKALESSEERFRFLAESIPQQVWITNSQGIVEYVNQRLVDYLNCSQEEVLKEGWKKFIHPDDYPAVLQCWKTSLETGNLFEIEYRWSPKNSSGDRWFLSRALPLRDQNGKIINWFGTNTDLHKHKLSEQALRKSEERFRNLVESTSDLVWEIDEYGNYTYVSPQSLEMLGYTPEEMVGTSVIDIIIGSNKQKIIAEVQQYIQNHQPIKDWIKRKVHKNGHIIFCEANGVPFFDTEGNFRGYRGICRDVTKRKELESELQEALQKEKELNELKSRFVSMTSHEFRTPLSTILTSAEILEHYRHQLSEERQVNHIHRIQNAVQRMTNMLSDILILGKAEAEKLENQPVLIDLVSYCYNLIEELQLSVKYQALSVSNNARIEFNCSYKSLIGEVDDKLLGQILQNLLVNAIKYSLEDGLVNFSLEIIQDTVNFTIQDAGIGIPHAEIPHVFASFFRATNVGNIQGSGLGLAIVHKCVELLQGKISVMSEIGVGTKFTITLPFSVQSFQQ
ncbi:PAS domain S-box protein [Calothrix sp. 336/3]|uniref:PAS domain S-box protein n=1 Tax=Calothrix sp. 336/3 TaxID=1337936 RepID=UPI00069A83E6|nr:PAS domain S-box protein [Calothrix sp. 336/3]